MSRRFRVALIGTARYGIAEPFAGGLEAHTALTAYALNDLGHQVTVFAGSPSALVPGDLDVLPILDRALDYTSSTRMDNAMPPGRYEADYAGYQSVLAAVSEPGRFDVVHNNSLHYLPPVLDTSLDVPMVHAVHCPPFSELAEAHGFRAEQSDQRLGAVIAVSESLARQYLPVECTVVGNGVAIQDWPYGDGGSDCVWAGRIVPEKGPHLAIDAARMAGRSIVLAGPVLHPEYFEREVMPRLSPNARWAGHLNGKELADLYGSGSVGVMTPCWDEPFGLVAAEMLACGTPVAALDRGAMREVIDPAVGVLAQRDDVAGLAAAIDTAENLDRRICRKYAEEYLSAEVMAERYVELYRQAIAAWRS